VSKSVISVDRVTKRFSGHTAVKELSLEVQQGAVFGLLGPNGAGKTTTIRMIMDIIRPDEGRVTLFGGAGTGRDLSARIGFLPEERGASGPTKRSKTCPRGCNKKYNSSAR